MEAARRRLRAAFEFFTKLGVRRIALTEKIKPTWVSQISDLMSVYCASTGELLHIPRQVSRQICLRTLFIINLCFYIINIYFFPEMWLLKVPPWRSPTGTWMS